jgi:hypothetical protein
LGKAVAGYTYKRVERSLAFALEIPTERRSQLAARIKHLRRCGLKGPAQPAEGRSEYLGEDVDKLLVALALTRNYIDPAIAARTVLEHWRWPKGGKKPREKELAEIVRLARASDFDEYGIFIKLQVDNLLLGSEPTVKLSWLRLRELSDFSGERLNAWLLAFLPSAYGQTMISLSFLIHKLDAALEAPLESLP